MKTYNVTNINGRYITLHSNTDIEVGSTVTIEINATNFDIIVVSCCGCDSFYVIEAVLSTEVKEIADYLVSGRYDIPKIQTLYKEYQKRAEDSILKLSSEKERLNKELEMYSSILTIVNYLSKHISDSSNIHKTVADILLGALGADYVSVYKESRLGYLMLKCTNAPCVKHHKAVHNYNKMIKNGVCNTSAIEKVIIQGTDIDSNGYIKYLIGIPFMEHDSLDYIVVEHHDIHAFTEAHIKYLDIISAQLTSFFESREMYMRIKDSSNKDGLTGLFNREYLIDKLETAIKNKEFNYAVCMIDIDDFKVCNDTYGHLYGDEVLKAIANIFKTSIRKTDVVARYGGEEIICCFFSVSNRQALFHRVNLIREAVSRISIEDKQYNPTVSIGISFGQKDLTVQSAIKLADDCLYKAKRTGKNKVVSNNIQREV